MNHLIFTAVITDCLGIGGYQQGSEFFGPSQKGLGHDHHYDPGQLKLFPHWFLASPCISTLHPVHCGSFGRYNIHFKVFCWMITVYPIVTSLTGFQFSNLLPYLLQVAMLIPMKSIKTLLQDMYLNYYGSVVYESRAAASGTNSCTPFILAMNAQNQPKQRCYNNCGQIGIIPVFVPIPTLKGLIPDTRWEKRGQFRDRDAPS
ncbi:hypothetical protein DSO57_1034951 [Entomophthora muscae]|uniref:Uncharacterized protein n=1 Tax=Entomophthora muscae TaxID=34485 RepID=A0ACC2RQP1_9FUNG|nr:hypothetical protein DSO57_1034951 [Entomophthora muscae]